MNGVRLCLVVLLSLLVSLPAAAATVSNVGLVEHPDRVEIVYELTSYEPCTVTLLGSEDGGLSYALNIQSVEGDVGDGITEGRDKRLVWHLEKDYPAGLEGDGIMLMLQLDEALAAGDVRELEWALEQCLEQPEAQRDCLEPLINLARVEPDILEEWLFRDDEQANMDAVQVAGWIGEAGCVEPLIDVMENIRLPAGENQYRKRKTVVTKQTVQVTRRSPPKTRICRTG